MTFIKSPYAVVILVLNVIFAYHLLKYYNQPVNQKKKASKASNQLTSTLPYREYTLEELLSYNGISNEHILIGVGNRIYDVTSSPQYYGSEGAYAAFAGRDASQSLAINKVLNFPEGKAQKYSNLDYLTQEERDTLNGWISFFDDKYPRVGTIVKQHTWAGSDQEDGIVGVDRGALLDHMEFPQ